RHPGLQLLPQPGEVLADRRRQHRDGPGRLTGTGAAAPHPARPDDLGMADTAYQIAFDGEAVAEDFYGDVASLTVEESTDAAGTLQFRLLLALQGDGSWSYLDDDRLTLFKKVQVSVGFTGGGGLAGALGALAGGLTGGAGG